MEHAADSRTESNFVRRFLHRWLVGETATVLKNISLIWANGLIASALQMSFFFKRGAFTDPTCQYSTSVGWLVIPELPLIETGTSVNLLIWSIVECDIILLAACLPTLSTSLH